MDNKLIHGVFRRVNKGRVRDLLTGKIHESFTVAADQLFQRGYMNEDERIALSGVIGDVLPKFQEGIDDSVGNRPVDTKDLQAIAEMSMVKRTNSRTKCMSCDAKPTVACHWANGHGMAWFCDKHFKEWLEEDDRDICGVWVLENGECPEDIRKNPKGTNKIRKLGDDVSYEEIYQRIENKSYPAPHCGNEGEQGGSAPRDTCSAGGTTKSPSKLGGSIGSTKTPRSGLMSATFKNKKDLYKAALADGWKPDRKSKTPRFSKTTTVGDTTILSEAISLGYGDRGEVLRIVAQSTRTASSRIGEKAREMLKPREVEPPLDRTWYDEVSGGIRGRWTEEHATKWHAWMQGNTVEMTTEEALSEGIIDKDGNFMAYAMEPSTGIYLRNVDIDAVKTMRIAFTNPSSRTGRRKHPKSLFQAPPQSVLRGGPGSGHHGHRGVRGQTGGSLPRSKGTHLGGLGVPDMKDASKRSFVSQRIVQVGGETVVALVSLRRMDVFKTKPYRLESRWYVKGRRGPATSEQQDAGTELLGELEISTVSMMEISGWGRSTYRTNLWVAPWGNVLIVPEKLTTRGMEIKSYPAPHCGLKDERGGSAPRDTCSASGPTGGVARPRHAAGVTPLEMITPSKPWEYSSEEEKEAYSKDRERRQQEDQEYWEAENARRREGDLRTIGQGVQTKETYLDEPTQRSEDGVFGTAYTEDTWTDLAAELMEKQPPEIQERMAEIEEMIREGTQSIEEHRDAETGEWTPERRALHERIIQGAMAYAGEAPERAEGEKPQVWVTGGLPGSGKTSILQQREAFPEGTVEIDSDYIKTQLPEYDGWNATLLHEESSAIVQELFRRATSEGRDIVYDATLKTTDKAEEMITGLKDIGYEANVIYVDVPMAVAMERAINRFANQGGRYVSPLYIASHDSKNVRTLAEIRTSVSSWEHWDNSQPSGQEPTLLATGGERADRERRQQEDQEYWDAKEIRDKAGDLRTIDQVGGM